MRRIILTTRNNVYPCHVFPSTLIRVYKINQNYFSEFAYRSTSKMSLKKDPDLEFKYKDAIYALNQLQTNAITLQEIKKGKECNLIDSCLMRFQKNYDFLSRSGLTLKELDKLPVIHITGTKGKGSTSAYCESILRNHGYKTGFFSSPHLISVRERIRLNGKPIDIPMFLKYFWKVYNNLQESKTNDRDMPAYFQFLTEMAFHTFLEEKVDVAIFEVGIGGEYDTTNILRKVPVVGITSLAIDHQAILGNSIEEITWHKSGIMKSGCEAFTVEQSNNVWDILKTRSYEKQCMLTMVPNLDEYEIENYSDWDKFSKSLIYVQKLNISLAVQLAFAWMKRYDRKKLNRKTLEGIMNCKWPGRTQILKTNLGKFYLDGAHTMESIQVCSDWFRERISPQSDRVLIFNTTGPRDSKPYLKILSECNFQSVYFVPNMVTTVTDPKSGNQTSFKNPDLLQYARCEEHQKMYEEIDSTCKSHVFPSVAHALEHLEGGHNIERDILVTGSLHLIGAVLRLLDPNLELSNSM